MKTSFFALFCLLSLPLMANENESILSVQVNYKEVAFQVHSGGCTKQEHFRVSKQEQEILLVRTIPDHCKANMTVWIRYSFDELKIAEGETFLVRVRDVDVHTMRKHLPHGFICTGKDSRFVYEAPFENKPASLTWIRDADRTHVHYDPSKRVVEGSKTRFDISETGTGNARTISKLVVPSTCAEESFVGEIHERTLYLDVGATIENDPNLHQATRVTQLHCTRF